MDRNGLAVHKEWATPLAGAIALIGAGIALAIAAAASYTDPAAMLFIGIAAIGLIVTGTISLVRRPRLALLDGPTLVVKTIRGRRTLTMADVDHISVLHTRRIVGRSRQMIIDLSDDRLLVFGRWDLGEDPTAVVERLQVAGFPVEWD